MLQHTPSPPLSFKNHLAGRVEEEGGRGSKLVLETTIVNKELQVYVARFLPFHRSESNKHGTRADLAFDLAVTFYRNRELDFTVTCRERVPSSYLVDQGRSWGEGGGGEEEESLVCQGLRVFVCCWRNN